MKTFEDFSRFSRVPFSEEGDYPELVTHCSKIQSAEDTLRYNREIKNAFLDLWPYLEARYRSTAIAAYVEMAAKLVAARYY
jgi:hypothetical protein